MKNMKNISLITVLLACFVFPAWAQETESAVVEEASEEVLEKRLIEELYGAPFHVAQPGAPGRAPSRPIVAVDLAAEPAAERPGGGE